MSLTKTKEVYKYDWPNDTRRWATIEMKDKEFLRCDFHGVREIYAIDDWQFLHDLSREILKLNGGEMKDYLPSVSDVVDEHYDNREVVCKFNYPVPC